ncbi:hypothetical protein ES703_55946 [subsurface metagenome]
MNEVVLAGIIAASAAIVSSITTSFVSFRVAYRNQKIDALKKKYVKACFDIIAFDEIEKLLIKDIAKKIGKSPENGNYSPSKYAVPSILTQEIAKYSD